MNDKPQAVMMQKPEALDDSDERDRGNGDANRAANERGPATRYRDNAIDGFRNGACLDLRVRLAIELLSHSALYSGAGYHDAGEGDPTRLARHALDVASALLDEAESRGLVENFPEGAELGKTLTNHIRRQVRFQIEGQRENMRAQADAEKIATPIAGGAAAMFPPRAN